MVTLSDPPALKRTVSSLWASNDIPSELAWIEKLSPLHYRKFIVELHDAAGGAFISNDWDVVAELLEDWEATAEIDANPKLARRLLSNAREKGYRELDL